MAWENQKKPKVAVCMPHTSTVTFEWADKVLCALKTPVADFDKVFQLARGIPLDQAREIMAEAALTTDVTHFWFQDTDVVPEAPITDVNQVISTLLRQNVDIACGIYRAKQAPIPAAQDPMAKMGFTWATWMLTPDGDHVTPVAMPPPPTNWYTVDVTGLGCALISRKVFEKIQKPWFPWVKGGLSEDFGFFKKAKAAGFSCWILSACKFSHIGDIKVLLDGGFRTLEV
jgi:hypothetical protein